MDTRALILAFPADINLEIFFRLPLGILREVVGEDWFRGHYCRILHSIVARNRPNSLILEGAVDDVVNQWVYLLPSLEVDYTRNIEAPENVRVHLEGSSNGIVCLCVDVNHGDWYRLIIRLMNPVFFPDQVRELPPSPNPLPGLDDFEILPIVAFSYLGNSQNYRVLHVSQAGEHTLVELFRSETNTWSEISPNWPALVDGHLWLLQERREPPLLITDRNVQFVINDAVYFLVWRGDNAIGMVTFSFTLERFTVIREFVDVLPPPSRHELGIFSPAVAVREYTEQGAEHFHLTEYVEESWTPSINLFTSTPRLVAFFHLPLALRTIIHHKESMNHIN